MKAKATELLIACILIILVSFSASAQISFVNQSDFILDTKSTITLMTADMNNDQQDDIISLENGNEIVIHLNNMLGRRWKTIKGPSVNYSWAGIIGDFNQDGKMEIVCGSQSAPFRIYTFDYTTEAFTLYYEFDTGFFIQNMNVVDLDNDGWLDLFLCDDDGSNFILMNDGLGNLVEEDIIDWNTTPSSDNSGNYGSVFLDFDFDGDQDLYIAKCRGFATEYDDPRRINRFFINDGNQNFTDVADEMGIAIGAQSWVADFADLDLDGDNDLIVANHYDDLQVLENINNETFEERQEGCGIGLQNSFWQLSFMDLDNDGYQDVIVTADDLYIYLNNGDFTFTPLSLNPGSPITRDFTVTVGDYNNDGFYDLSTGYGGLTNTSNSFVDSIWLNTGNDNDWIDLKLRGTSSNRNAIGATIYCYQPGRTQIYQIKGGHSYGIMNTTTAHFGLGDLGIDSIVVQWPGGDKEKYVGLETNRKHFIEENGCMGFVQSADIEDTFICQGLSGQLSASFSDFQNWSNGQTESDILYNGQDVIFPDYQIDDCMLEGWKLYPFYEDTVTQELQSEVLAESYQPCPGEVIEIEVEGENILWSDGGMDNIYQSIVEENFSVSYDDICQSYNIDYQRVDLSSNFIKPDELFEYENGDDIFIDVVNEQSNWYDTEADLVPFHTGSTYTFENVINDREVFIENVFSNQYKGMAGFEEAAVSASAPGQFVSPSISFYVSEELNLKSVDVYTDIAGTRVIQVFTSENIFVAEQSFLIGTGKTTLELNLNLAQGAYYMKTDEFVNEEELGTTGPQFYRENGFEEIYPLTDENGFISISGNNYNNPFSYYSFYNWQIEGAEKICEELRHKVTLQSVNNVELSEKLNIKYNNPISDKLIIELEGTFKISILDANGRVVMDLQHENLSNISTGEFVAGFYFLKIENEVFSIAKIE